MKSVLQLNLGNFVILFRKRETQDEVSEVRNTCHQSNAIDQKTEPGNKDWVDHIRKRENSIWEYAGYIK